MTQPSVSGSVAKGKLLYEGKSKRLYETEDPELIFLEFTDRATAFNSKKVGTIQSKGAINSQVSGRLFKILESKGVATHFVRALSDTEVLVKRLEVIPVEVTIRNKAAGRMAELFAIEEGTLLACPVCEFHYKSDPLGDPLINEYHVLSLKIATEEELKVMRERSFQVNNVLKPFFLERGLELIDFKVEFGRAKGKIFLGDEISPDTCRLWDVDTGRKLDKDRFLRDLGDVEGAYREVHGRILRG